MDLGLQGRSVLITGASKGIGLSCALAFAEEGCDLHLAARTASDLEAAAEQVRGRHQVSASVYPMDLSDSANVRDLAARCGDVDILVNNAGAIPGGSLDGIDEETWRRAWDLKVFGYINLTREILARMRARGSGVIINDIGAAGENVDAGYIAGSAGNASLMAFTRALGGVSLDYGVRVLGVNPGPVTTERLVTLLKRRAEDKFGDAGRWQELISRFPGGRAATPEEIADLIVFLASDRAGSVSGVVYTVDRGIAARRVAT